MKRLRDTQRERLYAAERDVFLYEDNPDQLPDHDAAQRWVNRCVRSRWFRKRWPWVIRVEVVPVRKNANPCQRGAGIFLPTGWGLNRWVILHELAHVICNAYREPAHGRRYCRVYLTLLQHYLGVDFTRRFKVALRARKVRYSLPRKVTETQRLALAQHRFAVPGRAPLGTAAVKQ